MTRGSDGPTGNGLRSDRFFPRRRETQQGNTNKQDKAEIGRGRAMTATSSGAIKETNKETSVASVVNAGSAGWASSSGSAGGSARKRVSAKEAAATSGPGVQHEARAETGLGAFATCGAFRSRTPGGRLPGGRGTRQRAQIQYPRFHRLSSSSRESRLKPVRQTP
jgi:hypothetical protein